MITAAESKEPSQDFLNALKDLKLIWNDDSTDYDIELLEKQYSSLHALGKREGLSFNFIDYKLHEIETSCKECNQQITSDNRDEPFYQNICKNFEDRCNINTYFKYVGTNFKVVLDYTNNMASRSSRNSVC
jgi:hypothetical protein